MKSSRLISAVLVSALLLTSCSELKTFIGIQQPEVTETSVDEIEETLAFNDNEPESNVPIEAEESVSGETAAETAPAEPQNNIPDEIRTAAYASYLQLIESQKDDISLYTWMSNESFYEIDNTWLVSLEAVPCSLVDITGDGLDELLVLKVQRDEETGTVTSAMLDVYTYDAENDEPLCLLEITDLDVRSRNGNTCYLFAKLNDGSFLMFSSDSYDEVWNDSFYVYSFDGETFTRTLSITAAEETSPDFTDIVLRYYIDGTEVSEEDYNARCNDLISQIRTLLQYNFVLYGPLCDAVYGMSSNAMTYDSAYEILSAASASHFESLDADMTILFFGQIQDDYIMGGTGGRSAILVVNPDGTISYNYHDSGFDEYNICHATGRIGNVRIIRDGVFAVDVTELTLEYPEGTEWTETDEFGAVTSYYATDSFGIHQGDVLLFYSAGVSTSSLPTTYLQWYMTPRGLTAPGTVPDPFPLDGFFNVTDECAFIEEEYD